MDYLVIEYPPVHSLARLNGTQIVFIGDAGLGWATYRMLNRTPAAMSFIGGGQNHDEITLRTDCVMNASEFPKRREVLSSRPQRPTLYRTRPNDE